MQFEMLRAHQRYLPLIGQRQRRTDTDFAPPQSVQVEAPAKAILLNALEAQGALRGGPLFGKREASTLQIRYANQAGYSARSARDPLALDPCYLLGLTDAYRQCDPALDWVGHWMTWPDSQLPGQRELLYWYDEAHDLQLVSPEHCLLLVGWVDQQLTALAAVTDETTGECEWLPASIWRGEQ